MPMHRWHFQRLYRWLIPVLLCVLSLCMTIHSHKKAGYGLAFLDDEAYTDLAVARNLAGSFSYGMQPEGRMPATENIIWRLMLAMGGWITGDFRAASYLLGAVFSVVTLLLCLRLARFLFPFPPFILYTAVLVAIAPRLVMDGVSGTSMALATALVTGACLFHIEGLSGRRHTLPVGSAIFIGLAMWIRIEFSLLWVLFILHALIVGPFKERGEYFAEILAHAITGIVVIILCILPLLIWNYQLLKVPWPQAVGAPLTVDAMASGSQSAMSGLSMSFSHLLTSFGWWNQVPAMKIFLVSFFAWCGAVFILGLSFGRSEERPYTLVLFLLLLLPVLYALVYPYVGWKNAGLVFNTLGPLCVITASFGVFRIPFIAEGLYRKWKQGVPTATGFNIWWAVMGTILMLACFINNRNLLKVRTGQLQEMMSVREQVATALRVGEVKGESVLTDAPGWISYELKRPVVDLNGEGNPHILTCLGEQGRVDPSKLKAYLEEGRPDLLAIWREDDLYLAEALPCIKSLSLTSKDLESKIRICQLRWP